MCGAIASIKLVGRMEILFVALAVSASEVAANDDTILGRLQTVDASVLSTLTLTFERESPAHSMLPDQGTTTMECTMTTSKTAWALECQTTKQTPVIYRAPGTPGFQEIDYVDGNLIIWRLDAFKTLADGSINETYYEHVGTIVAPSGLIVKQGKTAMRSVYNLSDPQNRHEMYRCLWAAGLGFSENLKGEVEQETSKKGVIPVRATGSYGASLHGTWELNVDSDNGHLVRSASFTSERSDKPSIILKTSGTKNFDNVQIAQEGRFEYPMLPHKDETILRFHRFTPNSDENFLTRIREDLKKARANDEVELMDYRDPTGPIRTRNAPIDQR